MWFKTSWGAKLMRMVRSAPEGVPRNDEIVVGALAMPGAYTSEHRTVDVAAADVEGNRIPTSPDAELQALDKHNRALQVEAERYREQLAEMQRENEQLEARAVNEETRREELEKRHRVDTEELRTARERSERELANRTTLLLKSESQLRDATTDLKAAREFLLDDSDQKELIQDFRRLDDVIGDMAHQLINMLSIADDAIDARLAQAIHQTSQANNLGLYPCLDFLAPFVWYSAAVRCSLDFVVQTAAQAVLARILYDRIFLPFSPHPRGVATDHQGLDGDLLALQARIQTRESQQHSARWRTITYNALKDGREEEVIRVEVLREVEEAYLNMLRLLAPSLSDDELQSAVSETRKSLEDVIAQALVWQDKARGVHCGFDYTPYLVRPGNPFQETQMLDGGLPAQIRLSEHSTGVMVTTSLGLAATRTVEDGNGRRVRQPLVSVKAIVLVARDSIS